MEETLLVVDENDEKEFFVTRDTDAITASDGNEVASDPNSAEDDFEVTAGSNVVASTSPLEADLEGVQFNFQRSLKKFFLELGKKWMVKEAIMLLKLALPLIVMSIFLQLPFFITFLFVGHFSGKNELDSTLLGNAFVNITGMSMIIGMATAADTLCPQSYGYKNYKRVGVIMQRGLLIISVACVPIVVVWLNSETLLLLFKQDPCIVNGAGKLIRIVILLLPGFIVYQMLTKYLQAQSLVMVFTVIGLISNICLVVLCAVFVAVLKLGAVGSAISLVLANTVSPVLLLLYIKWRKLYVLTWGGWSFESLTEWWQFVRLGLPGMLTLAFEWWAFEISTLVAGAISTTQLAISSAVLQLNSLYFTVALGMALAVNVRVGNELGAGNIVAAKRSSLVAVALQTIFTIAVSIVTISARNYVGYIFISNPEVVSGIGDTMTTAIGVIFLDQYQGLISGIMRATGRQALVAVINFFSYYIVGLPLGISLALAADMKSKGIWLGLSVADLIQSTALFVLLLKTNWKKESEKAVMNARSGNEDILSTGSNSSLNAQDSGIDGEILHNSEEQPNNVLPAQRGGTRINESHNNVKVTLLKFLRNPMADAGWMSHVKHRTTREEGTLGEEMTQLVSEDDHRESGVDMTSEDSSHLIQLDDQGHQLAEKSGDRIEEEADVVGMKLYRTSSRFCVTKFSIVLSKVVILLVGVALLIAGSILAAAVRHHPEGCDEMSPNCSEVCLNSSQEVWDDMSVASTCQDIVKPSNLISPSVTSCLPLSSSLIASVSGELVSSDCVCDLMPTPSL